MNCFDTYKNTKVDYRTHFGRLLKKALSKASVPKNDKFPCAVVNMPFKDYDRLINVDEMCMN